MAESSHSTSLDKESVSTTANNKKREAHCDSVAKKWRSTDSREGSELYFEIEADAAEDKGSRRTMEDASVLLPHPSLDFPGKLRCAHFAIYDGHGGRLAAEYAQKHLHANVLSAGLPLYVASSGYFLFCFCSLYYEIIVVLSMNLQLDVKAAKKAILEGFRRTDESLLQESNKGGWQDGAAAVCVWVLGSKVFVANIGDAKAILARSSPTDGSNNSADGSTPIKAIVLTREHKAIYPQERARIQKGDLSVPMDDCKRALKFPELSEIDSSRRSSCKEKGEGKSDGAFATYTVHISSAKSCSLSVLALEVGVIATPDVHSFELTERDHFMILGCDGLWGVFGPSDAVDFVQKLLKEGLPVSAVSRRLVREAVRERQCKDNCSAVVIAFRKKQ
ncbi:hypothetical protein RND71_029382 [Anisodus tanguticus]|uniref:PPM-type phosphatase domain-containing protein n=1 Tax=Anisodus tanguticus TaxID=243964 RepID=A0AAE1RD94_9SOLA|nr:hypothetical protein RND71_029382 [Anisodus tanguticus]